MGRRAPVRVGAVLALLWLLGWLVGSPIAARIVTARIQQRFAAQVEIGAVRYLPPYWVVARDVVVASDLAGERVTWLGLASLRVALDWLPFRDGSVRIAALTVRGPTVAVIRAADGVHDVLELWRGDATEVPDELPRLLSVQDARLAYRDVTTEGSGEPLAVGGVEITLRTASEQPRIYAVTVDGGDARLAIDATGTLDVEQRTLVLAELDARFRLDVPAGGDEVATVPDLRLSGFQGGLALAERSLSVSAGTIAFPGDPPFAAEGVRGTFALRDGRIDATDLAAQLAGGSVAAAFAARWDQAPTWELSGTASEVDVAALARRFPQLGGRGVRGRLSGNGSFSGIITPDSAALLDSLRGSGRGRVREGQFYEVPLVAKLLEQSGLGPQAVTLSNAAAAVHIAQRTIILDNLAIGSDTLGVQGHGGVGFDGGIDLEMVVVPLGDWRAQLHTGSVPLVGNALGSLVGKVESLVSEGSALVYQFHITGTVQDPKLAPVPVPALTRKAAGVLGRMVTTGWQGDVLGGG